MSSAQPLRFQPQSTDPRQPLSQGLPFLQSPSLSHLGLAAPATAAPCPPARGSSFPLWDGQGSLHGSPKSPFGASSWRLFSNS